MRHTPINLNAPDRSPLWYELRMKGIGASEAAAAANQDPKYSNPWFIYCLKTGEIEEQQETRAMRLGKEVEPIIAREYTIETGIKIEQCPLGMYRHPTHDFMFCSPDAAVSWENGNRWRVQDVTSRLRSIPEREEGGTLCRNRASGTTAKPNGFSR